MLRFVYTKTVLKNERESDLSSSLAENKFCMISIALLTIDKRVNGYRKTIFAFVFAYEQCEQTFIPIRDSVLSKVKQ